MFYELKNELKTLRKEVQGLELTKEEKKLIYTEITRLQKEAKKKDSTIEETKKYAEELRTELIKQVEKKKSQKGYRNV